MKKIFDDRGFLTEEGNNTSQMISLKHALGEMLEAMSINELQTMGCILQKIVGDMVSSTIQHKTSETNKLFNMTDEEFQKHLEDKYSPIYGKDWQFRSLTDEESERYESIAKKMADDFFEQKRKRETLNSLPCFHKHIMLPGPSFRKD